MQIYQAELSGVDLSTHPPWKGKIVSTYPKVINILNPEGLICSLVKKQDFMNSLSVLVPQLFQKNDYRNPCILKSLQGKSLHFTPEGPVLEDKFFIYINRCKKWSGTPSREILSGLDLSKLDIMKEAVIKKGRGGGLIGLLKLNEKTNLFLNRSFETLKNIQVRKNNSNGFIIHGISSLVGLGPGFTPSGDDFLTGALLGEKIVSYLSRDRSSGALYKLVIEKKEIHASLNKTSTQGKTLLWQALRGHFPAYLLNMTQEIANSKDEEEIYESVARAINHGETSGTDSAVGISWFLELLNSIIKIFLGV